MGGLSLPGQKAGRRGPPTVSPQSEASPFAKWFPAFLRDELRPYPGRGLLALRYLLAATLTMLVIVTFRLAGAAVGGFYSLLLPRESPFTIAKSALSTLTAVVVSLGFSSLGSMLFVDYPLTHFLWIIGSFFVAFFALSVMSNYGAASAFAILIVLNVPAWDVPVPSAAVVFTNLWTAGSIALALGATLVVEFGFALFATTDQYEAGLGERLGTVAGYLEQCAHGAVTEQTRSKVRQLAMVSVSRLRALALGSNVAAQERARRSTIVALVGRLVDVAATLEPLEHASEDAAKMLARLAHEVRLLQGKLSAPVKASLHGPTEKPAGMMQPLLLELDSAAQSLRYSLESGSGGMVTLDRAQPPNPPILAADAFSNPEHLNFALRGCLAAVICYFVMNAVAWPGLGPSLFTCVVTALTSIGSSRQKQLLRFSGALVGGVIFGMGSQVLILPMLDGLAGFLVMFMVVTGIAAWFLTSSPRLSYFGAQMALAFFLIHLRGPGPQTNLAIARDNISGILLGLLVMWFAFDTLGSKPAAEVMRDLFATNLKLMAKLAEPWEGGRKADLAAIRGLREKISQNFGAVNAQADAVLFELGRGRVASLRLRNRLLVWQPRLRTLFLLQITLLQYRVPIEPASLPEGIRCAQTEFDSALRELLERLGEHFAHHSVKRLRADTLQQRYEALTRAVDEAYGEHRTARAAGVLALAFQVVRLTETLSREIVQA